METSPSLLKSAIRQIVWGGSLQALQTRFKTISIMLTATSFTKWVPRAFERDSVHCGSMSERHWRQEEETPTERRQVIKLRQCRPTEGGRGWRYAETRLAGNKKWISLSLTPLNTDPHSLFPVVLCCLTLSLALYLNPLSASVGGCYPTRKWRSLYLPQGSLDGVGAHPLARPKVELYRRENMQKKKGDPV